MVSIAELNVLLSGRDEVSKAFKSAHDSAGGFGEKLAGIGKMATVAFAAVGAGAAGAAGALFKVGKDFDAAFDTIAIGTGATGQDLERLNDSFKDVFKSVPTDMNSAAMAIADLNTRTGASGEALEMLSKQMLEMTRLTGGDLSTNIKSVTRLMGDWGIAANEDGVDAMDKLFVASQATGIGIDELSNQMVQFGAPLRQLGFGFETSAALLAKFEKEGVNAELVMGSLRIALGKMAKDGEPAEETLARTVDAIKNAGSVSEANAIALELFGARAGPDMAAAIREGRFAVDDLVAMMNDSSGAIAETAASTADFGEKWTLFKNRALVALQPVSTAVFDFAGKFMDFFGERMLPVIVAFGDKFAAKVAPMIPVVAEFGRKLAAFVATDVAPKIEAIADAFANVLPHVQAAAVAVGEKLWPPLKAIGDFVASHKEIWGAFAIVVGGLAAAWAAYAIAQAAATVATLAFTAIPIIALITGIIIGLTALVAGIIWVAKNWDELTEKYQVLEDVSNAVKTAWEALTDFIDSKVVPALQAAARWFGDEVVPAMRAVGDFITGTLGPKMLSIAGWINEHVIPKVSALVKAWVDLHIWFAMNIPPILAFIGSVGAKVIEVAGTVGRWVGVVGDKFDSMKSRIEGPINSAIGLIQALIDAINRIPTPGDVIGKVGDIGSAAGGLIDKGTGWIPGRAIGGPVTEGFPYLVGERGRELFVPDRDGTIVPNGEFGMGDTYNITVVAEGASYADVRRALEDALAERDRRPGIAQSMRARGGW